MNMLAISTGLKTAVIAKTARPMAVLAKNSPQILLGLGIAGVITSTVLACKATLKVNEIVKETKETIDIINHEGSLGKEHYSKEDAGKDLVIVYAQTGMKFVKLYGPAVIVGLVSIGFIMKSHSILSMRNAGMAAAYKVLDSTFKAYRGRVVEELGEVKDQQFRYGIQEEKITTEEIDPETGKVKKVKGIIKKTTIDDEASEYARFFDHYSVQWRKIPEYNLVFLNHAQKAANDMLYMKGHVFLNEVYDLLGIPRSKAGAVVGWMANGAVGDGKITFGMYDVNKSGAREFVNGYTDAILLDFNVDGLIWDQI